MSKSTLREQLKKKGQTLRVQPVAFPERELTLYVRNITSTQYGLFEASSTSVAEDGKVNFERRNHREKLLVFALCNEQGERLYEDDEILELGGLDADVLRACYDAAAELNGLTKAAKEAAKNASAPGPVGDSPTA